MADESANDKIFRLLGRWENPIAEYDIQGIGKCRLCWMTVGDEIELGKLYPKSKNEFTPEELADYTLRFILRKSKEDKGASLTEEEVKLITKELKEEIFEKLLDKATYLYRENKTTSKKNKDGIQEIEITEGEILHPRNENESAIQYYQRVKSLYDQEQVKKFQNTFKKLNFSSTLNDQILKSMKNLDAIVNPLKDMDQILNPFKSISDSFRTQGVLPKIHAEPVPKFHHLDLKIPESPQLKIMRDLRNDIKANHKQSMTVFADISKSLIGMMNELEGSTKDTNKSLVIAIISLMVSITIGCVQLFFEVKNNDMVELKSQLQKSYEVQKEFVSRIDSLEKQKIEQEKLILNELRKINRSGK